MALIQWLHIGITTIVSAFFGLPQPKNKDIERLEKEVESYQKLSDKARLCRDYQAIGGDMYQAYQKYLKTKNR